MTDVWSMTQLEANDALKIHQKISGDSETVREDLILRATGYGYGAPRGDVYPKELHHTCSCGCGRTYHSGEAANVAALRRLLEEHGDRLLFPGAPTDTEKRATCVVCSKSFVTARVTALYCSESHRLKAKRQLLREVK